MIGQDDTVFGIRSSGFKFSLVPASSEVVPGRLLYFQHWPLLRVALIRLLDIFTRMVWTGHHDTLEPISARGWLMKNIFTLPQLSASEREVFEALWEGIFCRIFHGASETQTYNFGYSLQKCGAYQDVEHRQRKTTISTDLARKRFFLLSRQSRE